MEQQILIIFDGVLVLTLDRTPALHYIFYIKAAALNKSDSLEGRMKVSSLNSKSDPGGFSKMFAKSFEDHDTNFPTLIQLRARGNIFLSRKSIILIKCKLVIIMVSVVQSGLRCMLIMSVHCYLL